MAPGRFRLRLEPEDYIIFKSDYVFNNVSVSIKLTNITEKRQLIKVKATSVTLYQVRPVYTYLQPNESIPIKFYFIGRHIPEKGSPQYFDIYHMATDEDGLPKEVWKACADEPDGFQRMHVKFLKSDGSEWPPLTLAPLTPLFDRKWQPRPSAYTAIPDESTRSPSLAVDPTQPLSVNATQLSHTQHKTLSKISGPTSTKRCSVDPLKPIQPPTLATPPTEISHARAAPLQMMKMDERLRGQIAVPSQPLPEKSDSAQPSVLKHSQTSTTSDTTVSKSADKNSLG